MFWKMAGLSTTSPIDSILDKSAYSLEELLDEDRLIQECKALNSRLVNFLQAKEQVQLMIHYIIDEPPEGADTKRAFKYPFVCCQVFTCEIESILKAITENEEIVDLLFSFLNPEYKHSALLSGYFSKVVISLLVRENSAVVQYLQAHEDILRKIVDLLGITSIKEVLMRLVGADERTYHAESAEWICKTDLLEMLVEKLKPEYSAEDHANAADTLCAIARTAPSGLASKLASPSFVATILDHALADPKSKSALVNSLSVCISLLDRKRGFLRQPLTTSAFTPPASAETVEAMLLRLGDLLVLLDKSNDENKLPTTYGELRPPFGVHRLKIVEFIAVLLNSNSEAARQELIKLQALQLVVDYFFEFPFNNMLHSFLETIVISCIDHGYGLVDTLFVDCDFITKLIAANENSTASDTRSSPSPKPPPRIGNIGHLTRIANRLAQAANTNLRIQNYLQSHSRWSQWQTTVLQPRNMLENVHHWTCGRPTAIRDRPAESDDEEFRDLRDQDYDVTRLASSMTREVFQSGMYDDDDVEELHLPGTIERDDEDVYYDDETAQVVIRTIHLDDEQERLSSPVWYGYRSFSRDDNGEASPSVGSDEDIAAGDEENDLADTATSSNGEARAAGLDVSTGFSAEDDTGLNLDYFSSKPDWANFTDYDLPDARKEDFGENNPFTANFDSKRAFAAQAATESATMEQAEAEGVTMEQTMEQQGEAVGVTMEQHGATTVQTESEGVTIEEKHHGEAKTGPDLAMLPEESEVILGVESEGTAKAMENALKEGIVGEAGPLKPKPTSTDAPHDNEINAEAQEFNDVNYWRSGIDDAVIDEQS